MFRYCRARHPSRRLCEGIAIEFADPAIYCEAPLPQPVGVDGGVEDVQGLYQSGDWARSTANRGVRLIQTPLGQSGGARRKSLNNLLEREPPPLHRPANQLGHVGVKCNCGSHSIIMAYMDVM